MAGDKPEWIGLVLEGQTYIEKEDIEGRRSLVACIEPGEMFAEALCCAGVQESPVSVCAATETQVLLLRFERILHTCPAACAHHAQLLQNMLRILARKNLYLQGRMELLGIRSLRERILRYLENTVPEKGKTIAIPFNREELADYLGAERSALSHELSRMKKDGILDYWKNQFMLLPQG